MKTLLIAGVAVLAAGAAFAQSGGQMAVPTGPDKQVYDVPAGSKDQEIIIQTRDLKDGESVTPHIHHGVEMTRCRHWQPSGTLHQGPADEGHPCRRKLPSMLAQASATAARPAPGSPPVHLAVTLVIDKGTAPRSPVTDVLIPK